MKWTMILILFLALWLPAKTASAICKYRPPDIPVLQEDGVPVYLPVPPPPNPPRLVTYYDSALMTNMYQSMKEPPQDGRAKVRVNWQYSLEDARKKSKENHTPYVIYFANAETAKVAGEGPEGWKAYKDAHNGSSPTPTIFESHIMMHWLASVGLDIFVKIPVNEENRKLAEEFNAPENSLIVMLPDGTWNAKFLGGSECTEHKVSTYLNTVFSRHFPTLNRKGADAVRVQPLKTDLGWAFHFTDKVFSGAAPKGEQGFQALKDLGVKTVVCVDGQPPDAETAKKFGIRCVHIPVSYSGISEDQTRQLARAVMDLPGPIYIHCIRGINRAPAAAAAALVMLGQMNSSKAAACMKTIGVESIYKGLYSSVAAVPVADPQVLAALDIRFTEKAATSSTVEAMSGINKIWQRLEKAERAGWKVSKDDEQSPGQDAMLLLAKMADLRGLPETKALPESYLKLAREGETAATGMAQAWNSADPAKLTDENVKTLNARFQQAGKSCMECHTQFRDNIRR
jgi:protein tyrosine phosphatase (PTP) superfamily phosphohydrolase (DUF442 family)